MPACAVRRLKSRLLFAPASPPTVASRDWNANSSNPGLRSHAFVLSLRHGSLFGEIAGHEELGPEALARALARSDPWRQLRNAVMVVRRNPPLLGIIGHFDEEDEARVPRLLKIIEGALRRLRYVDYGEVERACDELGSLLQKRLGPELDNHAFAAIPRGGLVVLGLLAYRLDLSPGQIGRAVPEDRPLVVVDDCALTGVRFRQFLSSLPHRRVVFAPLYSHPDLRRAIEEREERVHTCVSSRDLADHAPELMGAEAVAWREAWLGRPTEERYWIGITDHLCFPWSEAQTLMEHPDTGATEPGWRIVPPELCLRQRYADDAGEARLQVQPVGPGPLRPASSVLYGRLGDRIVVADGASGESFGLEGVAADMWETIVREGSLDRAGEVLQGIYEVDAPTLRDDLEAFSEELAARGLLEGLDDRTGDR